MPGGCDGAPIRTRAGERCLERTGAAQAKAFLTEPSRAACGACHDDVNFATGTNYPGGFQTDDNQCHNCHIAQGETPFDASILGAHVVENDTAATYPPNPNTLITSVQVTITGVTNTSAGQKPQVSFTVKDVNGHPLALSDLEDLQFTLAGPTTDYGYISFGSDVTTPGYVAEDGTLGSCNSSDEGNTIDFMLSPYRDLTAAKLFLQLALHRTGQIRPRVINVDGHPAYARAISELKDSRELGRRCRCRPSPYLNNVLEQDHRFIKKRIAASLGFRSVEGALRTIDGYEAMHMIRKGQVRWLEKDDVIGQVRFIQRLLGIAA